ncbi:MAG: esterase, partial [Pyrinomonadaceae bacterium]
MISPRTSKSIPSPYDDRRIAFRILAPNAQAVKLIGGDIPNNQGAPLSKGDYGVWEATLGPVVPGA